MLSSNCSEELNEFIRVNSSFNFIIYRLISVAIENYAKISCGSLHKLTDYLIHTRYVYVLVYIKERNRGRNIIELKCLLNIFTKWNHLMFDLHIRA